MNIGGQLRSLAGVVLKDLPRYWRALSSEGNGYLSLCNRNERLEWSPDHVGIRCLWRWTSDLHAPKYLPWLGSRLARRAFAEHPIRRVPERSEGNQQPAVSFIVGHRGVARLPHLLATLESIAGQERASVECLVVEQDVEPQLSGRLPGWVRHIHTPPPSADMPYCRSWALNVGARRVRGEVLILHDNDMLVSTDYAASLLAQVRRGYEVVNLKRFIFYLSERHTGTFFAGHAGLIDRPPEAIMQNLEAGGSIAITREAYDRIGGMDESFIGWGGEDNEFWERAQTLRVWSYAHLPLWHLWHAPQAGKYRKESETLRRYQQLSTLPVHTRIALLNAKPAGEMSGAGGKG